ncbi:ABC transporter substrate-binding protein [Paenibacillus whitsoniae]|uniref:ABC transporter substrate-binding protein n=1 Tax=Paenibacillus whitsoniae TaxID=2496558 RepID=A0A3S0I6N8_9BACL|nr:ABC transporter substrate-binding protein [Paenibacillus whitsoniae]RTE03067.1 ABC transporter substrate-binding protein [Paenibacillus whitsoniae]
MHKKLITLSTLTAISMLTLSACSSTATTSTSANGTQAPNATNAAKSTAAASGKKVKITYWTPFSGGDGDYMNAMVKKFNEESTDIVVEQDPSKADDYYTKLQTALAADQAPDVAIVHSSRLPQLAPAGYLNTLDDVAAKAGVNWNDFNQTILKSTVYDNKHYSIPLDTHVVVMYYNKKWLQQAGVLKDGKPDIAKGPEGYVNFLQKIKDTVPKDIAPLTEPNVRIDSLWLFWSWYNQMNDGGKVLSDDGKKSVLDNPAATKAIQYVNDLYKKQLIPPNIDDAFKMFQDGKAATLITGVWATGAFESTKDLDFGVMPVPTLYDRPAEWGDSHTLTLPKHSKDDPEKLKAAATFANWIAQHGSMWAQAGHIPAVDKVLQSDEFKKMKYRPDYADAGKSVVYFPRSDKWGLMNDAIIKEFEKMTVQKQTPEDALKNASKAVDDILKK